MSSSYIDGTRIAIDISEESQLNSDTISAILDEIKKVCGDDVPLSTHLVQTLSHSWESVTAYDPFFEGVVLFSSVTEFAAKIKESRILIGSDVASYILSKIKCTHLSLEKLVYFAYADYLCEYSKRLFEDQIFAFTHGPVVKSVYDVYKRSGSQYIEPLEFGDDSVIQIGVKELPIRSRILFATDGIQKICSIDKTIDKYGKYTAGALVELTHRPGSPWSHVDSTKAYQTISDRLIKVYHHIECA